MATALGSVPELVRVLTELRENLNEGTSFAKSLAKHPTVFPPLFVNMVAAGEASGTLEGVLERLADFMEGQSRLKGKVSAALAYPILMVIIGGLLVGVLMVAVVPKVTSIFDSLGHALPWYTRLLIFVSDTLAGFWWLILGLVGLGIYLFRRWKKTAERCTQRAIRKHAFLSVPSLAHSALSIPSLARSAGEGQGRGRQASPAQALKDISPERKVTTCSESGTWWRPLPLAPRWRHS